MWRLTQALITGRWTIFITLHIICSRGSAGRRKWSHSQNSCTSSPQQTGAYVPPPTPRHHAPSDVFLVSGHLQLHLPQQVHAHAHGSSKPSVTGVFSVCFPRQQKTTDLPWERMTCCAGRHIWPHVWSSSFADYVHRDKATISEHNQKSSNTNT